MFSIMVRSAVSVVVKGQVWKRMFYHTFAPEFTNCKMRNQPWQR